MPTTNIYGVTYPASSALVTDGATAMQTISTGFDTAVQEQASAIYGRNLIDNPEFSLNKRNSQTIAAGVGGYICDRWLWNQNSASGTANPYYSVPIGGSYPNASINALLWVNVASSTGTGAYFYASQKMSPGVAHYSGAKLILSFYATNSAGRNLGVRFVQKFGTGGSPSADVATATQYTGALTGTFTRYSFTFNIPDVSGKVLGSNNDDSLELQMFFTSGTSGGAGTLANQTATGSYGVAGNEFRIYGVQVEYDYLTLYEQQSFIQTRMRCAAYFQTSYVGGWLLAGGAGAASQAGVIRFSGSTDGSGIVNMPVQFSVPMKTTPTMRFYTDAAGTLGSWDYARSAAAGTVAVTTRANSLTAYGFTLQNSATLGGNWVVANITGQWAASIDAW